MSTAAAEWDAHPYYHLLPSYVTKQSVEVERRALFRRVEQLCDRLARIYAGDDGEGERGLELRHFQDVGICFSLKHELPLALHARLLRVLIDLLWHREGHVLRSIDLEVQALRVLEISLRQLKKRMVRGSETTAEDLVIDWRAVKRSAERAFFRGNNSFRRGAEMPVMELVQSTMGCAEEARTLFRSRDASVPMITTLWNEFGASIKNLTSVHCYRDMAFFSLFFVLPVSEREAARTEVDRLLPEWFATWSKNSQNPEWDGHWLKLMSRIAKVYQDPALWKPYLPFIFAKVHDFLDFPSDLGDAVKTSSWPSEYSASNGSKDPVGYAMRLCVFLLSDQADSSDGGAGNSPSPSQLTLELFAVMKAFFHPSNVANVADSLGIALGSYTTALAKRLGREKAIPDPSRRTLSLETCRPLLTAITDMALMGIYSKSRSVATKCMSMIEVMICIDPAHCATPVLENMMNALDPVAMSHSHLAASAISSMAVFLYHLMYGKRPDTTGVFFSTYLTPILKLTLPGIDPSDDSKTISTISLYFQLLSWLPIVNDSAKGNFKTTKTRGALSKQLFKEMEGVVFASLVDLDEETDQKLWELGSFLEEWSLEVLDRCLQFLKSRTRDMESSSHGSQRQNATEDEAAREVVSLLALLYPQMSPAIYDQAVRKTVEFLNDIFLSSRSGGKLISRLIYKCLQGNPAVAFKQFIAIVLNKFRVTKTSIDVSTLTTSEKLWNLYLLNGMVRFDDPDDRFLLHYRDELRGILGHFLTKEEDKEVYEAASRVLQHLLVALTGVYTHDFRSLPREQWLDAVSNESGAFQYLGVSVSWKRLSISWHEPNAEELAFGFELLQEHLVKPLDELKELQSKKDTTVKAWSNRLNRVLNSIRGAVSIMVDGASAPSENALLNGAMPLLKNALVGNDDLFNRYAQLKPMVMARVHELVAFWRENGAGTTHEIPLYTSLLSAANQLLIWRGDHRSKFRMKEKENDIFKDTTTDVASRAFQKARCIAEKSSRMDRILLASRNELIERAVFFLAKRNYVAHFELVSYLDDDNSVASSTRALYETLLGDVENLLKNPYADIRSTASVVLSENSELYGRWLLSRVPSVLNGLTNPDVSEPLKEETVMGAIDMLAERNVIQHLWRKERGLLNQLLILFLKSNECIVKHVSGASSKSKVSKKLQNFFLLVVAHWSYVKMDDTSLDEPFGALLAAEPAGSEHWRFQAMFLATLYPLVQPEELPIPMAVWEITLRQLASNVIMPVRQIALIMFTQLVKVLKFAAIHEKGRYKSWVSESEALVYTRSTMEVLIDLMLKDRMSSGGSSSRSAASEWLSGAREVAFFLAGDRNAYPQSAPLSSVNLLNQPRAVMATLNFSRVKLVEKLVQSNPRAFFDVDTIEVLGALATEKFEPSVTEEDRHAALTTLAEWTSGMLRALMKMELADSEFISGRIQDVVKIIKQILPQLSAADVRQWVEVFYVISRPGNAKRAEITRLDGLVRYLLQELEESFARATQEDYARQAKWLHLIEALAIHFFAAGVADSVEDGHVRKLAEELGTRTVAVIRAHALAHQYESIRHRVGKMLFLVNMYSRASSSALPPGSTALSISSADEVLQEIIDTAALYTADGVESYVKGREKRAATHAKETAIHWLDWTVACGEQRDFLCIMPKLFQVALLTEKHAKPEVAEQARTVMDTVASWLRLYSVPSGGDGAGATVVVSADDVDALLKILETHGTSRAWKTRAAALRFLTTFAFFHWIYWSAELKERVYLLVREFLTDEQREVQAMAKFAMRSLIHHEHPAAVAALSDKLAKEAERTRTAFSKLKRRYEQLESSKAEISEVETARKRLKKNENEMARSVLGMSAAVLAFPHDLPQFVPPMVEALGKFLYVKGASSAVSFLGKEARETLLEFKRTHQDNWAETKARLTPAQRSAIEDVALAPSYFS